MGFILRSSEELAKRSRIKIGDFSFLHQNLDTMLYVQSTNISECSLNVGMGKNKAWWNKILILSKVFQNFWNKISVPVRTEKSRYDVMGWYKTYERGGGHGSGNLKVVFSTL